MALVGLMACALWAAGTGLPPNVDVPLRHGVVFFCPDKPEDAIRELVKIKADGFRLIEFASWVWTLPKPGSDVEKRAQAVLDWCDRNDLGFFLMHNIQWGSVGEGGGLDKQVLNPAETAPLIEDWARVLKGHKCVLGVILGNEVGPSLGTPADAPRLWGEFRGWLAARHGTIARLNEAWRTTYRSFDEVNVPPKDSPGWIDCRRYANERFGGFYGYLVRHDLRPALGEKLYGEKTSLDPFLHRACRGNTMTCWDDMMAMYPLWRIKCAADISGRPMFNSELHLYNDDYDYAPSIDKSLYRYLTSALMGEYLSASFAWGMWKKPEIAAIHTATPGLLAEVGRTDRWTKLLAAGYEAADVAVVVTENNYATPPEVTVESDYEQRHPLGLLYADMAALGRPWRYVLDEDVREMTRGTLVVWSAGLREDVARAMIALPAEVRIVAVGRVPDRDEYGRALDAGVVGKLQERVKAVSLDGLATAVGIELGLPEEYRRVAMVKYPWWGPERGSYDFDLPYCTIEARHVDLPEGRLVAVINNTETAQVAAVPWAAGKHVEDLIAGMEMSAAQAARQEFGPLAVRLYLCKP